MILDATWQGCQPVFTKKNTERLTKKAKKTDIVTKKPKEARRRHEINQKKRELVTRKVSSPHKKSEQNGLSPIKK